MFFDKNWENWIVKFSEKQLLVKIISKFILFPRTFISPI